MCELADEAASFKIMDEALEAGINFFDTADVYGDPQSPDMANRRDWVEGAGWETLFAAIDDHARIAFTAMHRDEKKHEAVEFVHNAVVYYAGLGVR